MKEKDINELDVYMDETGFRTGYGRAYLVINSGPQQDICA